MDFKLFFHLMIFTLDVIVWCSAAKIEGSFLDRHDAIAPKSSDSNLKRCQNTYKNLTLEQKTSCKYSFLLFGIQKHVY